MIGAQVDSHGPMRLSRGIRDMAHGNPKYETFQAPLGADPL